MSTINWKDTLSRNDWDTIQSHLKAMVSKSFFFRSNIGHDYLSFIEETTQELFLALFSKNRFSFYMENDMSDSEIDRQIFTLELGNMHSGMIRKAFPESFRLRTRISALLKSKSVFKKWPCADFLGSKHKVYGLSEWNYSKPVNNHYESLYEKISDLPRVRRNFLQMGCTGNTDIIITNSDLQELSVKIFRMIDSPCSVGIFRQLCLSKLDVMDVSFVPLEITDTDSEANDSYVLSPIQYVPLVEMRSVDLSPAEKKETEQKVNSVLCEMFPTNRNQKLRRKRFLSTLRYWLFDKNGKTQQEIAALYGVSDSLVSAERKRFTELMRNCNFSEEQKWYAFDFLEKRTRNS